jgi:geranylgeranyl diphosphate synthase type II
MRHAVFPGGARIRPRLCLSVARACSPAPKPDHQDASIMFGAASAIELLHCASLVHDDLPCFDDAAMRRGKPSVHVAFDERLAVLAGDALIVMAFEILAVEAAARPERLSALLSILARSVGMPLGIAAGQAWECEPHADLSAYQQAKTGALFAAASLAGAVAVGFEADPGWRDFGERLGEAFQVADDIRDVAGSAEQEGKPVGRDDALGRPNAALALGLPRAVERLEHLIASAIDQIPLCPGRAVLCAEIRAVTRSFLPQMIWEAAH